MMVNEVNNTSGPWQSTIPQQMPWMSPHGLTCPTTQFGQQSGSGSPYQPAHQSALTISMGPSQTQDQHHSMINFPTASTVTLPVTVCPTSTVANNQFGSTIDMPSSCVTTTTHSYPLIHNLPQASQPSIAPDYNLASLNLPCSNQTAGIYNPTNSYPQLVHVLDSPIEKNSNHKRCSIEMEDDQIKADEPPTKQLLSERRLFKRFGSLHIDKLLTESCSSYSPQGNSDDSEDDEQPQSTCNKSNANEREDFNRYVYLLFKDKKDNGKHFPTAYSSLDRLAREERDKLSKAVVLWNPPIKNFLNQSDVDDSEDEDEDFKYTDHKDFLKGYDTNSGEPDVIITEITNDGPSNSSPLDDAMRPLDYDDIMSE